jgi:putative hydrolase of the HAD superfamily
MKNYIFDLYGTLIDIHTDEEKDELWEKMAEYYNDFGTHYTKDSLKWRYHEICKEEEERLGGQYPEIRLEHVFFRLLKEDGGVSGMDDYEWCLLCARYFRGISRDQLIVYPGARELLKELKAQEKRIYLLSNAQTCFTLDEMLKCKLSSYFQAVYISSDYGIKKPDPNFMKMLVENERLDVDESVMIGNDLTTDIKVAACVNMKSFFINSYHHTPEQLKTEAACLGDYDDYKTFDTIEDIYKSINKNVDH